MKRFIAVFLVLLISACFCGCKKENTNETTTKPVLSIEEVKEENIETSQPETLKPQNKGIVNIALFGVDSRKQNSFTGMADSVMVLSINKELKTVKIISIMRDTLVPIIDENGNFKKYGKINSAYALGKSDVTKSAQIAVNTLNETYDLDISDYVVVNFYGMVEIIDAVGGINATITEDELTIKGKDKPNLNNCMDEICNEKGLNANDYYITRVGEQKLNGIQAVAYARVRHCRSTWYTNNDFGRTDRQRHIMQELFQKAVKTKKSQQINLIKGLLPCVETSLSANEIIDLASVLLEDPTFEDYRLPEDQYKDKMLITAPTNYGAVICYDIDYAARLVNAIIYENKNMAEFVEANPITQNAWYNSKR